MTNEARATAPARVTVHRADGVEYDRALRWQHAAADAVRARRDGGPSGEGECEALALIQHTPVYTMGARGGWTNLVDPSDMVTARGARLVETDRGGDITFHGPGQLVAYPILDLHRRGLHAVPYVRALETCVIETLAAFGIAGARVPGRPGVWVTAATPEPHRRPSPRSRRGESVDRTVNGAATTAFPSPPEGERGRGEGVLAIAGGRAASRQPAGPDVAKIAAIGVRIERGVSRHGLALNVDTDLAWFDAIVPCGIADAGVTSMARELDAVPAFDAVVAAFRDAFARVFDAYLVDAPEPLIVPSEQEVRA